MKTFFTILALLCMSPLAIAQSAPPAIHVQGQGSITIVPDAFEVTFVLEQRGPVVGKLNEQMNNELANIVGFLRSQGIEEKYIQSMQIRLNPWFESTSQGRQERGFVLTREIKITHNNIDDYDKIIDGVTGRGVDRIQQFEFVALDNADSYTNALILAVADAKARANILAKELGVKVGKVMQINENGSSPVYPVLETMTMRESAPVSLPGQQAITASVSVSFYIE